MDRFKNFHFQGQKQDENILSVLRRHWFDIAISFFLPFAILFLSLLGFFIIPEFFPDLKNPTVRIFIYFIESLAIMIIWIISYLIWVDYFFDIWIVTNKRIVNIEQKGLFNRQVSELELENIQDITVEVKGIIPTFLNYGDVFVQTAAERERFLFHNVPNPYAVKDMVMNLQKKQEKAEAREIGEIIHEKIHGDKNGFF